VNDEEARLRTTLTREVARMSILDATGHHKQQPNPQGLRTR